MVGLTSTRRGAIGVALVAAACAARPAAAAHAGGEAGHAPEAATLLAPGPEDGAHAALARRLATGLSRALVRATALRVATLGGPDGVTAANRFAASTPGEDRALLLLPGLAGQAALVGDNRVRFEARHWPAVCAGLVPAVLAGRLTLPAGPARVAVPGPGAPEVAGLLALELLGRPAVPVMVPSGMTAEAMVAAGMADMTVVAGPALPARLGSLGLQPLLAFDTPGQPRDPALPDTPGLSELLPDPTALVAAARAAGAALRLRGVLVLPALSSADTVALWRGAARRWAEEEPDAAEPGARRLVDRPAAAALGTLVPPPEVALAYREWLLRRFNWRAA